MYPHIGDEMPDIVLPRINGGELATSDLRGQRALYFFWGSW